MGPFSFKVGISAESRAITTFITRNGLYRYTRLMFGINCAPEIYQKIMEQILSGCSGCLNFIDDIIVFGEDMAEHDRNLAAVMDRLKVYDVVLNTDKCVFRVREITFLGHRLSSKGIEPAIDKIESIKLFRQPEKLDELQTFLGLVNFVSKFIPNVHIHRTITQVDPTQSSIHMDAGAIGCFRYDQEANVKRNVAWVLRRTRSHANNC